MTPGTNSSRPVLAVTQGDPAGIGPEILLQLAASEAADYRPLLVAERSALEAVRSVIPATLFDRLYFVSGVASRTTLQTIEGVAVLDPVGSRRTIHLGESGAADAGGAMAALDAGMALVRAGIADALVTAPVSKASIATHVRADFRGHTEYLAEACGLEVYGRDYLMAFLAPRLQVALLSTHLPLRAALDHATTANIVDALACLDRHAGGRVAVAGINPHAGEAGLLGAEDDRDVRPAVEQARARGIDAHGPESADSLFARAARDEFDWVLSLYHDQGLIAVKTASFGTATNWTLGLPFLRTSVDHGTAFGIAGRGIADAEPLRQVVATTLALLAGELPRGRR
ncbi:MAG: 4-hydroxythreonine-4-phosphate dehydrogenase PdxA [Acidobacteriota bacterium]